MSVSDDNVIDINSIKMKKTKEYLQSSYINSVIKFAHKELAKAPTLTESKEILDFLNKYKETEDKYKEILDEHYRKHKK